MIYHIRVGDVGKDTSDFLVSLDTEFCVIKVVSCTACNDLFSFDFLFRVQRAHLTY